MPKKGKRKKGKKAAAGVGDTLKDTALGVVDEVEKAGGVVLGEIRNSFDFIGDKVTSTARVAADTTVAVKDRVTSQEVTDQLHELVRDVEDAGASLIKVINSHFESLRKSIAKAPKPKKPKKPKKTGKKAAKKKSASKKAAKKKAVRKKTTRKKATAKKATAKKATAKKATRKKVTRKKPAAKRAPRKKTTTRKKTTRKRPAAKKSAARKTVRRKKTTRKR